MSHATRTRAASPPEGRAAVKPWSCILFDLDGTITDSAPGIIDRLARTLAELGRPIPLPAELVAFVGPPILDGFREVAGMSEEEARGALAVYRDLVLKDGPRSEAITFPGMLGLVRYLHKAGIPLAIATSKGEAQALRVLEFLGLSECFVVVCGSSPDETRSTKSDVVAETVRRLQDLHIDLGNPVLVGDRMHDVEGAFANGIPTIMVEWGYGSPQEAVGAIGIVHSVDQLRDLLI